MRYIKDIVKVCAVLGACLFTLSTTATIPARSATFIPQPTSVQQPPQAIHHPTPLPVTPVPTLTPRPKLPTPQPTAPPRPQPAPTGNVPDLIRAIFGRYAPGALAIARCESGYNPLAYNPTPVNGFHAEGVFQILYGGPGDTWSGTPYRTASPYNAVANIKAAYYIFARDGYSWREWQCRP